MRRFFRLLFKLGLLAAIGVGVALAVKKLTAPPLPTDELEPWPPLSPEPGTSEPGTSEPSTNEPVITEPGTVVDDRSPESANGSSGTTAEESSSSSN